MYKKNVKWLILGILAVIIFAVINGSSSKYAEVKDTNIILNISKPTYTIVFHPNNDEEEDTITQEFTYGTAQHLKPNTFIKEGYAFIKWNTEADKSGDYYVDGQEVNNLTKTNGEVIK